MCAQKVLTKFGQSLPAQYSMGNEINYGRVTGILFCTLYNRSTADTSGA